MKAAFRKVCNLTALQIEQDTHTLHRQQRRPWETGLLRNPIETLDVVAFKIAGRDRGSPRGCRRHQSAFPPAAAAMLVFLKPEMKISEHPTSRACNQYRCWAPPRRMTHEKT